MNADVADDLIREAAGHFNSGQREAAEAVCRRILAARPDFIPALHLASVIAFATNRMSEGTELLDRLFKRDPGYVPALVTMGDALAVKGEREGAAAVFQHAAGLRSYEATVQLKLADALTALDRFADAERSYLQALALDPAMLQARFNLGVLLMKQRRLPEAEAVYRCVVQHDPTHRGAWLNLGNVLVDLDKHDDAVHAYQQVLHCLPGIDASVPMALANLAGCLCDLDRTDEAILACRRALEIEPNYAPATINLGAALDAQGRFDEEVAAYRRAIDIEPTYAPATINLGAALDAQGRFDEAVAAYRRAIEIDPIAAKAYANLAVALRAIGALDEALAASRRAVELELSSPEIRFNHAHTLLMNGHWKAGFEELRWGKQCRLWADGYPSFEQPEWRGERFDGRTLLLFAEAGLGDTLQFVRYLPMVAERGGSILLQVQPALVPLLRDIRGVTVIPRGEPLPPFDLQLPLMWLPHVFGTTLASVPADVPYLRADAVKREEWRNLFGSVSALNVGVVWAGNPKHKGDRQRSIAAAAVLPRLAISGVQLYSLQKEPRAADRPVLQALGDNVIDLAPRLHDFAETAAAVAALDLIISVDTSVAHLAGALGRPTWILLPYALDWRWLRDREDTPWYPTMRLFRQERPQLWTGALARASEELARLATSTRRRYAHEIDRAALQDELV